MTWQHDAAARCCAVRNPSAHGHAQARETAYGDNLELMAKGVTLRKQTASLLGYPSWAHFVIERRMAGTPEAVTEFLGKIRDLAKDGASADREQLRQASLVGRLWRMRGMGCELSATRAARTERGGG